MKTSIKATTETQVMVFRTSITNQKDVSIAQTFLNHHPSIYRWSIDLDDWEKVLKVVTTDTSNIQVLDIENHIGQLGFECTELDH